MLLVTGGLVVLVVAGCANRPTRIDGQGLKVADAYVQAGYVDRRCNLLPSLTDPPDGTMADCSGFAYDWRVGLRPIVGARRLGRGCRSSHAFDQFLPNGVTLTPSAHDDCVAYLMVGREVGGRGSSGVWPFGTVRLWLDKVHGNWKVVADDFNGGTCFCPKLAKRPTWAKHDARL